MRQKTTTTHSSRRPPRPRPGQDMVTAKNEAGNFPSIGMTLRSYKYDPKDRHNTIGRPTVVRVSRWRRFRNRISFKKIFAICAIVMLLIGAWVGGKFIWNAHKLFGGNIFSVLTTSKLRGEDRGRVNILLAGNSSDDPGHDGANLTDSIMIISIDTRNNKAFLLSVPRDLWVHIPDDGHQKINAAYVYGEEENFSQSGYPKGGMGKLEQIIETDMGIPIDYYALVDYNAFKQSVDAVGGIDIQVQSPDPRGLYDPSIDYTTKGPLVRLSNGPHRLNGQQALDLARARGDAYGSYGFPQADFDRTTHQRQMLVALKSKAVSAGVIANPAKLSSLSDAIGNNVKTDFKLSEVHRLFDITKSINGNNIQSLSLNKADGKNLLASYNSPNGQSALIPEAGLDDFSEIQAFLKRQTSSDPVVQEGAQITVLNATGVQGLATKKKNALVSKNLIVTDIGDAKGLQATTTIIDASGNKKPATKKLLMQIYGKNITTVNPYSDLYDSDFIIVIGNDQLPKTTTTN